MSKRMVHTDIQNEVEDIDFALHIKGVEKDV